MHGKTKFAAGTMNQLQELVHKAGFHLQPRQALPPAPKQEPQLSNAEIHPEIHPEISDEELFSEAMDGVERVEWKHDFHHSSKPLPTVVHDTEAEERKLMQEAVSADTPIVILDHPEYIEGWVGVAGKRLLTNLRNGLYSIQGQIDLHGLNRAEAQIAVEDYIIRMSRFRPCCVKIIHGRGINSPADGATLKESLQRLLSTRRMSRYVVAYASAPSRDGGVGAVYVLLSCQ
jgi:DNA-nicking Smr family endonuclease